MVKRTGPYFVFQHKPHPGLRKKRNCQVNNSAKDFDQAPVVQKVDNLSIGQCVQESDLEILSLCSIVRQIRGIKCDSGLNLKMEELKNKCIRIQDITQL